MMKAVTIVMLFCIKAVYSAPCTTDPVTEGSTAVITQTVLEANVIRAYIQWRFTNVSGSDVTVTECNMVHDLACTNRLMGEDVYSTTVVWSGCSDYCLTLTIHSVTRLRDQTTWKWVASGDGGPGDSFIIGECDLDVYWLPQVELVGCPNADDSTQGYIRKKDNTKTCQCRLTEVGNPPGVAQWLDAQGNIVGQNGNLSLVYNPDDPTYTCRGHSDLGSGPTVKYQPKFAYPPTVTQYTANSNSTLLTISAGDTVTFVCNAEGNPKPNVTVKGERWKGDVTLQDTQSGLYGKESNGTKKMSCKDTDVYTCMADNGFGGGMSQNVSVFVECVLEMQVTSFIQELSPLNGTELKIEIPIIGFPQPTRYSLKKVIIHNNRIRRAVIGDEAVEARYNITYIPSNPPKGVVVLTMMGLTEKDSGQYVLTIDNGINDGLHYSFNTTTISDNKYPSDENDDDEEKNYDTVIGLIIGLVAAVILIAYLCLKLVEVKGTTSRLAKEHQLLQEQVQEQQQPNGIELLSWK